MGKRSRERMAGPEEERVARGVERAAQVPVVPEKRAAFPLLLLGAQALRRQRLERMGRMQRVQAGRAKALADHPPPPDGPAAMSDESRTVSGNDAAKDARPPAGA